MNNVVYLPARRRRNRLGEYRVVSRPRRKARVVSVPTLINVALSAAVFGVFLGMWLGGHK